MRILVNSHMDRLAFLVEVGEALPRAAAAADELADKVDHADLVSVRLEDPSALMIHEAVLVRVKRQCSSTELAGALWALHVEYTRLKQDGHRAYRVMPPDIPRVPTIRELFNSQMTCRVEVFVPDRRLQWSYLTHQYSYGVNLSDLYDVHGLAALEADQNNVISASDQEQACV